MSYKFVTSAGYSPLQILDLEILHHLPKTILGKTAGISEETRLSFPVLEAAIVVELQILCQDERDEVAAPGTL